MHHFFLSLFVCGKNLDKNKIIKHLPLATTVYDGVQCIKVVIIKH